MNGSQGKISHVTATFLCYLFKYGFLINDTTRRAFRQGPALLSLALHSDRDASMASSDNARCSVSLESTHSSSFEIMYRSKFGVDDCPQHEEDSATSPRQKRSELNSTFMSFCMRNSIQIWIIDVESFYNSGC